MKKQYYIAGRILEIFADFETGLSDKIEQFGTEGKTPDFTVCFEKINHLLQPQTPDISNDYDSKISVHEESDETVQVFHEGLCGDMFAKAYLDYENNREIIRYLERSLRQFQKMEQLFDWIGIDNIFAGLKTMILHAALINASGEGILFMGPSGVGKSTRADLWHRHAGAEIINGDRTFVNRDSSGVWKAYGSPYAGSSGYYVNKDVPVKAIMSVKRGGENEVSIKKLAFVQAFREVYRNITLHQWNDYAVKAVTSVIEELIFDIPVYEMICPPDIRAVETVRKELGTGR